MEAICVPQIISPAPIKPSFDPIFLPGASKLASTSRVPSRLPSPAPSSSAPNIPTLPCNLPPSPTASPVLLDLPVRKELHKPTLLTLPPEILRHILWFCSSPSPNLRKLTHDKLYIHRIKRNLPDLPVGTANALYATCHSLRYFLLNLGCRGAGLKINNTSGVTGWKLSYPIWAVAKEMSLRWDSGGMFVLPWGVEEEQWAIVKARSDARYGQQIPVEEAPKPPPKRADQINMTGEKPKDPKAYMEACRAYLQKPPPPPPLAKKHRPGVTVDLEVILRACEKLEYLSLDFPGSLEAFTEVVMRLKGNAWPLSTLKKLSLRNGNEMCFPPPKKLFVAIARLKGLEVVTVQGNCGGRESLFSPKERRRRGVFVNAAEGSLLGGVVRKLWGWECEALEMPERPVGLRVCNIIGMPGLGEGKDGTSSGVWCCALNGWPGELKARLEGAVDRIVKEELEGWSQG